MAEPARTTAPRAPDPALDPALAGARLTIDLAALASNWRRLSVLSGPAECAAVVKADGYGLGVVEVGRALADAGCRTFFVALPSEGVRLRRALPGARIFVLNGLLDAAIPALLAERLIPCLGSPEDVAAFAAVGGRAKAALHVDTGMNRLGARPEEAAALVAAARGADLELELVMSHLAVADTPAHPLNAVQAERFAALAGTLPRVPASLLNSAGLVSGRFPAYQLARPGVALYGGLAVEGLPALAPVVTLEARVLQMRTVRAGESIGYGAAETVRRDTPVAVVALGYADGYHRAAGSTDRAKGARARFEGVDLPILGRVSMDLIALDASAAPGLRRGDLVAFLDETITVDEVAGHAGTIGYEVLTGLGRRFERNYRG